jgi:hypothetical protein
MTCFSSRPAIGQAMFIFELNAHSMRQVLYQTNQLNGVLLLLLLA